MNFQIKYVSFIFLGALILTTAIYWPLFFSFYQQDEWRGIGDMLAFGFSGYLTFGLNFFQILFGQGRIFTAFLNYILFQSIPFNITLLACYSIIFHSLNIVLVYFLANKFFKSSTISAVCALFFGVNTVGQQAVSWFGASVATLTATTFILLSLVFFLRYFQLSKNRDLFSSYVLLIISLYFKESGLGLLPMYTLILFINSKKKSILFTIIIFLPLLYFFSFAIFRFLQTIFSPVKIAGYIHVSNPIVPKIISNSIIYVSTIVGQIFIPPQIAFYLAKKFILVVYPFTLNISEQQVEIIALSIGIDLLMVIASAVFITLLLLLEKKREKKMSLVFSTLLILASLIPYILIVRSNSYFESRYYYTVIIGGSLLLGTFLKQIIQSKLLTIIFFIFFVIFCCAHIFYTYNDLFYQNKLVETRIKILKGVKNSLPTLKKKTVIYITSDRSYYVPNNPLPFQQGIGYTMQVWLFNPQNSLLKPLLLKSFLWDLGTEGYQQINDEGYGFFYSLDDLKKTYAHYRLQPQDVFSFNWDSNSNTLKNTTQETRLSLK